MERGDEEDVEGDHDREGDEEDEERVGVGLVVGLVGHVLPQLRGAQLVHRPVLTVSKSTRPPFTNPHPRAVSRKWVPKCRGLSSNSKRTGIL